MTVCSLQVKIIQFTSTQVLHRHSIPFSQNIRISENMTRKRYTHVCK